MTLKFPFRDPSLVKAGYDFTPEKNDSNMLMFRSGDVRREKDFQRKFSHFLLQVLAVIDTAGDSGWWKAIKDNRIGYIPKDFVTSF